MSTVPTPSASSVSFWDQLHDVMGRAKFIGYCLAGVLAFMLFVETAHIYSLAAGIHPWLGMATLVMAGIAVALIVMPIRQFLAMPKVVEPPKVPARDQVGIRHLRNEVQYLDRYLANCDRNPAFADKHETILRARADLSGLRKRLDAATENQAADYDKELSVWSQTKMTTILAEVDERADRMIYQEALAVGVATAASPNGTLDAFVMLWRSVRLVSQLSVLYYGRPGVLGTLLVVRDVSVATAMAGFLQNVTDSLGNLLARALGGVTGVVAGPAVDGVTNALVLIRIGYLARERCRSFRQWDQQTQKSALVRALAATQKVAVGLATEIFRRAGGTLSVVAGQVAGGMATVAGGAADRLANVAGSAITVTSTAAESAVSAAVRAAESAATVATGFRQSIESKFRRKATTPPGDG